MADAVAAFCEYLRATPGRVQCDVVPQMLASTRNHVSQGARPLAAIQWLPMTISESLQTQWRRGQIIMNAVGVVPPLILFVTVFSGVAEHRKGAVTAWCLGTAVAAIAIWVLVGQRLRCPICRATVGRSMKKGTPLRTCPACGADFSQPMPGRSS